MDIIVRCAFVMPSIANTNHSRTSQCKYCANFLYVFGKFLSTGLCLCVRLLVGTRYSLAHSLSVSGNYYIYCSNSRDLRSDGKRQTIKKKYVNVSTKKSKKKEKTKDAQTLTPDNHKIPNEMKNDLFCCSVCAWVCFCLYNFICISLIHSVIFFLLFFFFSSVHTWCFAFASIFSRTDYDRLNATRSPIADGLWTLLVRTHIPFFMSIFFMFLFEHDDDCESVYLYTFALLSFIGLLWRLIPLHRHYYYIVIHFMDTFLYILFSFVRTLKPFNLIRVSPS